MKVALVTTTIHVPRILELMRKYDSGVRFFIAGDVKTPDLGTWDLLDNIDNVEYFDAHRQMRMDYRCGDIIGWNCIQRRNIALLEALKWGAELIVYWDDDNLPMDTGYFWHFQKHFDTKWDYDGLQVCHRTGWHNQYGPAHKHRGFPPELSITEPQFTHVVDAKVGVAAGLCLGNPDIDAYTRMAGHYQMLGGVSDLQRQGYLIGPDTRCVFNSQNTAFLRQFAPAMFMAPGIGRADDIFASILCQRIMRDRGYQVHIGPPFTYQERNQHNLVTDLKDEFFCYEHVLEIADFVDRMPVASSIIEMVRTYYGGCTILPQRASEAGLAFLEDIEKVMG